MSSGLDVEPRWFDAGSPEDLFKAARYMRNRQKQTGKLIGLSRGGCLSQGLDRLEGAGMERGTESSFSIWQIFD